MDKFVTQEITVNFFVPPGRRDNQQWLLAAGELFGPYDNYLEATAALPEIVRSLP